MSRSERLFPVRAVAGVAVAAAALTGCSQERATTDKPVIIASIYALQFAAEAVAGDRAEVVSLTPSGVEPHDLELSVQQVRQLKDAELIVYIAGLAQAVDDSVREVQSQTMETSAVLGAEAIAGDPHFWLNPMLVSAVANSIADRLGVIDAANKAEYAANAVAFAQRMQTLDTQWREKTANCATRDFVSSHASFGYLAKEYNLTAHAVLGLNPDAEPTPAALNEAIGIIQSKGLTTIYTEKLTANRIANTLAKETGAQVRLLDPVEGNSGNLGYEAIMQANLASFVAGNRCGQ